MLHAFDAALHIEQIEKNRTRSSAADRFSEVINGKRLNKGDYHNIRNASSVWNGLSAAQQRAFGEHEWIDMQIYEHGV